MLFLRKSSPNVVIIIVNIIFLNTLYICIESSTELVFACTKCILTYQFILFITNAFKIEVVLQGKIWKYPEVYHRFQWLAEKLCQSLSKPARGSLFSFSQMLYPNNGNIQKPCRLKVQTQRFVSGLFLTDWLFEVGKT